MRVKKEASGRRSVQTEFEVPGTPEEVWQAIATGPGMEPRAVLTAWDPPRMYAGQNEGWNGSPPIATEWNVQARAGGVCLVRVVHSLFASTDDWDNQLQSTETGWSAFLRTLQIYLTHFRGLRSTLMKWMVPAAGTEGEAWESLTTALGLRGASVGQHWTAPTGVPVLSGVVEYVSQSPYDILLRLDNPGPAAAAFGAVNMGGPSMVGLNVYLYGDRAAAIAAQQSPLWEAWFQEQFSMPSPASQGD